MLKFRGFCYALGQGNFDDWPSLWRLIPFLADCGFNQLVFYMDGEVSDKILSDVAAFFSYLFFDNRLD